MTITLLPSPARYISETFDHFLYFYSHWLLHCHYFLGLFYPYPADLSMYISYFFHPSFTLSPQKSAKIISDLHKNNDSLHKNERHASLHGTQNLFKNWFQPSFSPATLPATSFSITPMLHHLFQFEGWITPSSPKSTLLMHWCNFDVGLCFFALRYFESFMTVLNYSLPLSVTRSYLPATLTSGLAVWFVRPMNVSRSSISLQKV